NMVSGFQRPTGGRVELAGQDVTAWPAHRLARRGLGRTFQNVRLFPGLTLVENVEVAALRRRGSRKEARRHAVSLLRDVHLDQKLGADARSLTTGEERLLGIARALASRPTFLLLDEPAAGLTESESDHMVDFLRATRDEYGIGLMVIE